MNDLVGFFSSHTHLGCIADNGFRYMSGVRRIYFQDCAATSYTANSDFYFFIGDCAFANCENLEEVNMMQWTISGDNHWQTLSPTAVKRIWGSMLDNSPKAWLRVGTSDVQQQVIKAWDLIVEEWGDKGGDGDTAITEVTTDGANGPGRARQR